MGIPPEEQPPSYYRLLGLVQYESDPEVIENAANQRMAHLRSFQAGRNASDSQRLLNEVAAARVCLLNAEKKAAYDNTLRESEAPPAVPPSPTGPPPPLAPSQATPPIPAPPSPAIEVKEDWIDAHLHGHHDGPTDSRFSRSTLFALTGCGVALAAVILLVLFLQGGAPSEAILVFELADVDREELRLSIDGMERKLPPDGPLEFECEPGSHDVTMERPGYPAFSKEITLGVHERLTLIPEWGEPTQLVLAWPDEDRDDAKLFLDGRLQDFPLGDPEKPDKVVLPVSPGKRVVRIERPGFEPFEAEVVISAAESREVVPAFRKAGLPPQDTDLTQESEPSAPHAPDEMETVPQVPASMAGQDRPIGDEPAPTEATPKLHPVPSPSEQASALTSVDEAFNLTRADTGQKKAELAKRLLDMSAKARETPLDQFGILERGKQLAIAAENVDLAMRLVAAKGDAFEIDVLSEQAAVLAQIAESTLQTSVIDSLVNQGWGLLDIAVAAKRRDIADQLLNTLHTKIERQPWLSHAQQIGERYEKWQTVRNALTTLEANPDDPNANGHLGRWYLDCGEPEKAFPYMAKSQIEVISALAKDELIPPTVAEDQVALGDRWWNLAEDPKYTALREAFRNRAIHWYKQARPNLNSVILSEKIANRLGEAMASPSGTAPPQEIVYPLPDGKAIPKDKWEDLLVALNPLRDVTRGQWQQQGNMLASTAARSMLMFPVAIQGDYELEFQFSHASGRANGLIATIPVGSRTCNILFPYNNRQEILTNVNGQAFNTTVPPLEPGRPITAKISVTTQGSQKHIAVTVNSIPFLKWQGTETSLSGTGVGQLPRMNQPGLINTRDQYALNAARFRLLNGEARLITEPQLPPNPYLLTGDVGYYQGTVFQKFAPEDALLVGLRCAPGGLGVGDLQPVYRASNDQLKNGSWVGGTSQPAQSAIAKEGYAIGALEIRTQDGHLRGVTARFYRINEDGLDLSDSYDSPLLGQTGLDGTSVVETRGRPATGIHGLWNPGQIVSLGLVTARLPEDRLWKPAESGRFSYLSLLDLDPIQSTVAEMRFSRRLGIGTTDPQAWPIIDENSQQCPEFLYAPAPSRYIWKLTPATMKSFSAVGYCVEGRPVHFRVLVDGRIIHDSGEVRLAEMKVDLPTGEQFELQVHTLGNGTEAESFWLFPRVHARPANSVESFDERVGKGSMLVGRPPVSRAISQRDKSHKFLPPLYPVTGRCREFLYAHPPSRVVYRVPAGAKRFSAIGYCAASKAVRFRVSVNGKEVSRSGPLGIESIQVTLPRQAKTIELWTDSVPERRVNRDDICFWCFPRFHK